MRHLVFLFKFGMIDHLGKEQEGVLRRGAGLFKQIELPEGGLLKRGGLVEAILSNNCIG